MIETDVPFLVTFGKMITPGMDIAHGYYQFKKQFDAGTFSCARMQHHMLRRMLGPLLVLEADTPSNVTIPYWGHVLDGRTSHSLLEMSSSGHS